MADSRSAAECFGVMRMHNESVTSELPSILQGALIALAALGLSFIATSLALEHDHKPRIISSGVCR